MKVVGDRRLFLLERLIETRHDAGPGTDSNLSATGERGNRTLTPRAARFPLPRMPSAGKLTTAAGCGRMARASRIFVPATCGLETLWEIWNEQKQ